MNDQGTREAPLFAESRRRLEALPRWRTPVAVGRSVVALAAFAQWLLTSLSFGTSGLVVDALTIVAVVIGVPAWLWVERRSKTSARAPSGRLGRFLFTELVLFWCIPVLALASVFVGPLGDAATPSISLAVLGLAAASVAILSVVASWPILVVVGGTVEMVILLLGALILEGHPVLRFAWMTGCAGVIGILIAAGALGSLRPKMWSWITVSALVVAATLGGSLGAAASGITSTHQCPSAPGDRTATVSISGTVIRTRSTPYAPYPVFTDTPPVVDLLTVRDDAGTRCEVVVDQAGSYVVGDHVLVANCRPHPRTPTPLDDPDCRLTPPGPAVPAIPPAFPGGKACGPFDAALPPLLALPGRATVVDASGCNTGDVQVVPLNSAPWHVGADWTVVYAYTCSGSDGGGGVILFTPHDTVHGSDLAPVVGQGLVATGGSQVLPRSPAGEYLLNVSLRYPDVNTCLWRVAIHAAP